MEFYDASAPAEEEPAVEEVLDELQAEDSDRRLLQLFDRIDTMVEEGRERDRDRGVDPEILARLEAISGADDAPYELRDLHRRVGAGTLTWEELWLAPEEEPGGHLLVNAAMRAEGAALADALASFEAEEPGAGPDAGPGGVLGR